MHEDLLRSHNWIFSVYIATVISVSYYTLFCSVYFLLFQKLLSPMIVQQTFAWLSRYKRILKVAGKLLRKRNNCFRFTPTIVQLVFLLE